MAADRKSYLIIVKTNPPASLLSLDLRLVSAPPKYSTPSVSSALFNRPSQATDDSANPSLFKKLKRLYHAITDAETKAKQAKESGDAEGESLAVSC
ncbi:hypothetical protein NMY22_g221 [Coprinellus aureogranulatus]|nr:hypothetical protein NMY22_g221 [Coprinellus aureogranulatus]